MGFPIRDTAHVCVIFRRAVLPKWRPAAMVRVSCAPVFLLSLVAVQGLQMSRVCSRRDVMPHLGRAIATASAAVGAATVAQTPPAHAAAPCVDGAIRWKRYREGTGPKPPDACVEVPYNEAPEFQALPPDVATRRAEAEAKRQAEAKKTRDAFRLSLQARSGEDQRPIL
uniref:Uncharacterized protein n=1 Tax=Trieres chinensis TaxID=1514140 RepID=A0A7S2EP48_TRICV